MMNGLYRVALRTAHGSDRAVVVIENDRISGGDSRLFYEGSVVSEGEHFSGTLRVVAHFDVPTVAEVLGDSQASFEISGVFSGASAICSGVSVEHPEIRFDAMLSLLKCLEGCH